MIMILIVRLISLILNSKFILFDIIRIKSIKKITMGNIQKETSNEKISKQSQTKVNRLMVCSSKCE